MTKPGCACRGGPPRARPHRTPGPDRPGAAVHGGGLQQRVRHHHRTTWHTSSANARQGCVRRVTGIDLHRRAALAEGATPLEICHPCHGRTLAMQRMFDEIATTGCCIGASKTLAALMVHKLVRLAGYRQIMQGRIPLGIPVYEPTPDARRMWEAWKANGGG